MVKAAFNNIKIAAISTVVPSDAVIGGEDGNICSHCIIENKPVIGNRCTMKCCVQVRNRCSVQGRFL